MDLDSSIVKINKRKLNMGTLTQVLFFVFLVFNQSLGQEATDFKKLFKEFETNRESLRKSHVKTYSMNVGYFNCC